MFSSMTVKGCWLGSLMNKTKVLILGGTGDARKLARQIDALYADRIDLISSQAGVTQAPRPVAGRMVRGGFGGADGLQSFIEREEVKIVIDATHPFAQTISQSAFMACEAAHVQRMALVRPLWKLPKDGRWQEVADMGEAADVLSRSARRVFVTTGRRELEVFSDLDDIWFLIRMIEMPKESLPIRQHQIVMGRPPYELQAERDLLASNAIEAVLTKHSGGVAMDAKITAALEADIRIILLRRPPPAPGLTTDSVEGCLEWLKSQI